MQIRCIQMFGQYYPDSSPLGRRGIKSLFELIEFLYKKYVLSVSHLGSFILAHFHGFNHRMIIHKHVCRHCYHTRQPHQILFHDTFVHGLIQAILPYDNIFHKNPVGNIRILKGSKESALTKCGMIT